MRLAGLIAAVVVGAVACSAGWTDADTKSATNASRVELSVDRICAPDAGSCTPSQVRALERAAYCANTSMLYSHGQAVADAGIRCQ